MSEEIKRSSESSSWIASKRAYSNSILHQPPLRMKKKLANAVSLSKLPPTGVSVRDEGVKSKGKSNKPTLPSTEVGPTALTCVTHDLDLQSPASYGHVLLTGKSSRLTVSWF